MCIIFTDCMWWYQMTCFRNLETLSPLQHWVSTESALSVQLRHSWCWQAWFPLSCLGHLWNDDNDVHVSCIQLVAQLSSLRGLNRTEIKVPMASGPTLRSDGLCKSMQFVCVCFSTKETDTYSHHLFRKKKYIKPVRLLISFMHVDRSIMQMQRNSAVAHEVLTEQTEFLVSLMSLSHLSSHLSHLSRSSRSAHSARPSGWPG